MTTPSTFTEVLIQDAQPILRALLEHPFNKGLGAGTLPRENFIHYLRQDGLYLVDSSRALSLLAGRCAREADVLRLLDLARDGLLAERALHEDFFQRFHVTPEATAMGPACAHASAYLLSQAALAPRAVALAALLPCFWVYREVGRAIFASAAAASAPNPYSAWIALYSGPAFEASADAALQLVEALAFEAGAAERAEMRAAFFTSCRLEWLFWDDAWHLRAWPF